MNKIVKKLKDLFLGKELKALNEKFQKEHERMCREVPGYGDLNHSENLFL